MKYIVIILHLTHSALLHHEDEQSLSALYSSQWQVQNAVSHRGHGYFYTVRGKIGNKNDFFSEIKKKKERKKNQNNHNSSALTVS